MATLLEASRISPQTPCVAADLFLPLTFSDIRWVNYHPLRQLIFYKHPCSAADFLDTIVPKLKQSLSLTLKHYPPVAGNLLLPSDNEKLPMIRYVAGDSVSMTVAASGRDFDDLVGNHARDADQFYDLMPQMPPATEEPGYRIVPLMAIQVTLFPGRGVCFAVANHHSLGDASSVARFTWAWAAINKLGGDEEFLIKEVGDSLPIFDRSVVKYPPGLDARIWGMIRGSRHRPMSFPVPTDRVRATYILHQADIKKLKDFVSSKKPGLGRVFVGCVEPNQVERFGGFVSHRKNNKYEGP